MKKEDLIQFENKIVKLYEDGQISHMLHICGGNEDELIKIFENIKKEDYVFSTHRTHYHYLLAGGSPEDLENKILNGESMYVFNKDINFLSTSIVAGGPCVAAGIALGLKMLNSSKHVWCFIGDGAEDQGHFYEAVRYVEGFDLPCTFIIEDNNRSVEATKNDRYGNSEIKWNEKYVIRYHYTPTYPHSGTNSKKWLKFKIYE
jgi:pyruvate dehydrogenase E1 component alpha subunit